MSLESKITTALKEAMKNKNQTALTALRAVKSAILLHKTQKSSDGELSNEDEMKILQKLVKQRKESAEIYLSQERPELAKIESDQANIIKEFLPEQLSEADIEKTVIEIISKINASGMKDMGKVMGIASKELSGKADGKTISQIVRKNLV